MENKSKTILAMYVNWLFYTELVFMHMLGVNTVKFKIKLWYVTT